MAVTPEEVRHVAGLARLGIPDAELAQYVAQLNGILGHMEVLQKVKTSGVAEADHAGMAVRDDVVAPVKLARALGDFAPAMRDGFFLVPRLATHEDGEES